MSSVPGIMCRHHIGIHIVRLSATSGHRGAIKARSLRYHCSSDSIPKSILTETNAVGLGHEHSTMSADLSCHATGVVVLHAAFEMEVFRIRSVSVSIVPNNLVQISSQFESNGKIAVCFYKYL
jgi:hypothetical protein